MAKAAPKKITKLVANKGKLGRRPAAKTTKVVKAAMPVKKPAATKVPAVSKDELRAQLEKAQNTIATLRIKSREAVRAAKLSAAQIAALEAKLALLEKKLAAQAKPAKSSAAVAKPVKPRGRKPAEPAVVEMPVETDTIAPVEPATED